jgi:putative inorganic carbon (HCO3(-)) transporter
MIIDMDLLIDVHFFSDDRVLSSIEGLHLSVTTFALIALYILWWIDIITKRRENINFFAKTSIAASGYILSSFLSIFNAVNISMSFFSLFFLVQMFMVYFYIANYIKSTDDVIYIINILLACLFIQSAVILIQYNTRTYFNFTGKTLSGFAFSYSHEGKAMEVFRSAGTSGDPNDAGGHISMLILITLSLLLYKKNHFKNIFVCIILLISVTALILTFSRGSWIGFTVGLVVFLFAALRYRWISVRKIVAIAALTGIILCVFSIPIAARLIQDDKGSAYGRVPLMKLAFNMIQEHPFIGVGANNFGIVLQQYLSSELRGQWLHLVHNQYLLIFAETGVVGIFFFLLIMALVVHTCIQCIMAKDPILSPLSAGVISAIIALSLYMAVELSISRMTVQLFWTVVSIAIASERLIRMNKQQFLNSPTP